MRLTFFSFSTQSAGMALASTTSTWAKRREQGWGKGPMQQPTSSPVQVSRRACRGASRHLHRQGLRQLLRARGRVGGGLLNL